MFYDHNVKFMIIMKVACIIKIHTTFLTNLALAKIVITNGSIPYDCKIIIIIYYYIIVISYLAKWTNFGKQDITWAKFSTLDVGGCPHCSLHDYRQNRLEYS